MQPRVVRIVLLEHAPGVVGEGLVAEPGVAFGEGGDGVVLVGRLRVAFQQALGAADGRQPGAAAHVVERGVHLVAREHVAQRDHALARVVGVAAVREARGDDAEVVVGLLRGGEVAAAGVEAPHALQEHGVAVGVHQAAQVVHVGVVAVARIGAQEAVDGRDRVVVAARLELGVGGFHQRLLGVRAVGILRDEALERDFGAVVVAAAQRLVALGVQLLDRHALVRVLVLEHALDPAAAGAGEEHGGEQQQREARKPERLGHGRGTWGTERG